jgi:glycosyltransferase involved in cell wall biosynthesis
MRLPLTRISVVLPVYNEASTVGVIIEKVLALELPDVDIELIIVESNSTDGSREIVQRYAGQPGVTLILQDRPRGKGAAVREGFAHATGDILLIQDGDLEYRVDEYSVVLAPLLAGDVNFVLGCRHARGKPMRVFPEAKLKSRVMNAAHWVFTGMFNLVYRTHLRDPFTMYKVFRRSCIDSVHFEANRFDFDWELVAKLVRLGNVPVEVPITYEARGFDRGKKVRFFRDPLTWMVALVKYRFSTLHAVPNEAPVRLHPVTQTSKEPAVTVRTLAVQADIPANGNGIKRNDGDEDAEPESQRARP